MGEPINRVIWMGSFGALMVIYRSKIEHYFFSTQKAMDNINQQLEAANKKLKTKQKQLTDAENQSTILTHRMKQSKKNIENLLTHLKSDNSSKVKLLKQNLQENIKDPDAEYPVLNAVTRANESFIQNLNKLHPNLTAYEVNLLSLLLLKLNTNQICNQLLITEGSLRKAKTRLRKKLGLEERANLYDFAQSIA
jgi:DNA-binding CsgD family transcriptional regulator